MSIAVDMDSAVLDLERRLAPIRELYPFEPRLIEHPGGLRQHFVDEGPRVAPPVLCVHGNPTWSFLWRDLIRRLSPSHRVIAPDHLGMGLSDGAPGRSLRLVDHVKNLERLVLSLDLRGITLVLHDWGGPIGLGLARRHPERIARLVVTNTAAFRSERIPLRIAACRLPVFGQLAIQGLNAFARAATWMAVARPLPAAVKRGFLLPYSDWTSRAATRAFVDDIPLNESHASWAELVEIERFLPDLAHLPRRLVWGMRDWCFSPHFLERWHEIWPEAEVDALADAGHYLLEDAGARALDSVQDFLERHPVS